MFPGVTVPRSVVDLVLDEIALYNLCGEDCWQVSLRYLFMEKHYIVILKKIIALQASRIEIT